MKRYMLHTLLLSLAAVLLGCGGDGKDEPAPAINITVSQESISVPAAGGEYTINVTTTGKEWGAYTEQDFITIDAQNTLSKSGTLKISVAANPFTDTRTGTVTIMSSSARKSINITQEAAAEAAYYAPDGYTLVWRDEFDKGSELNGDDWRHEVQNSGWVNHEL